MKNLYIFLFALLTINSATAQPCLPEGITFTTQEQIDNFQTNYPGCTEIEGNVSVLGFQSTIKNLNGLNSITAIGGDLQITGTDSLVNLFGLDNLQSIGGSIIIGGYLWTSPNYSLIDFSGLEGLTSIGGSIAITNNFALTSLIGLENIQPGSIENLTIYGNFDLSNCNVQSVCDYLSAPNGIVSVYCNANGCNNPAEVANECGFTLPCLPYGNYHLTSQEEIDNFQTNYPGCSELEGDVYIQSYGNGTSITNLNGLSVLNSVSGNLAVGRMGMYGGGGNPFLTGLSGLENLTSVGEGLQVYGNDPLIDLSGFESLTFIGGNLSIYRNYSLTSLSGMENLNSVGGNVFIGYMYPEYSNPSLKNLSGFEGLISIGGYLEINNNDSLISLNGLNNLTSIGGDCRIIFNNALISLIGLDNVQSNSIANLEVYENYSLSDCDVQSICDYLANPNGLIDIWGNAAGCNSIEEVEAACLTTVVEIKTGNGILISPNPSNDKITISLPSINGKTQLSIFNVSGEKVLERQLTDTETQLDINALPRGVYFVRVQDKRMTEVMKLIKQ